MNKDELHKLIETKQPNICQIVAYKDGEEVYDTLEAIISALFDASAVSKEAKLTLKLLALLNVSGLETSLINKFFPDIQTETITALSANGWIYADSRVRLHPVIA